jgi:hypothetical protein
MQKNKKKGLSVLELFLVLALFPVVSLAIYTTFNSGIKIYQRINRCLPLEKLNLFLNKFNEDLRNSFPFKIIPFKGERESLSFGCFLYDPQFKTEVPAKVLYFYDPDKKTLIRRKYYYSEIFFDLEGKEKETLENVIDLNFKYYYYNKENNEFVWQDKTLEDKIPLAVKVEFNFRENEKENFYTYTVSLPISQ